MQLSPHSSSHDSIFFMVNFTAKFKGNIGSDGAELETGRKNTQFSANKSPYLRNGARYDQAYYVGLIGSRICAFDWYQNHIDLGWAWTANKFLGILRYFAYLGVNNG